MTGKGNRQHGVPYLIKGEISRRLDRVRLDGKGKGTFDENWLQNLLFENPNLLPVDEIEAAFSPLIPVCRELPTSAGPLDILFINPRGMLTLVECKLWRNPEARREVVGQILDYTKELSQWNFEDLEEAVKKAAGREFSGLYELANQVQEETEEEVFIDTVTKNLKKGRFLLLIVGDGIREDVEKISEFLQTHANLNFTFALVEETVFSLPENMGGGLLVQPMILARTIEIERSLVRLEHDSMIMEPIASPGKTIPGGGRRIKISEEEFYRELEQTDSNAARELPGFIEKCLELGFYTKFGDSSLMLHWDSPDSVDFNFVTFKKDGKTLTNYFAERTLQIGHLEIGEQYLESIASTLENSNVVKKGKPWCWHVKKNKDYPAISDMLEVQDKWIEIIKETMEKINQVS